MTRSRWFNNLSAAENAEADRSSQEDVAWTKIIRQSASNEQQHSQPVQLIHEPEPPAPLWVDEICHLLLGEHCACPATASESLHPAVNRTSIHVRHRS